jgi:hypothetical protein
MNSIRSAVLFLIATAAFGQFRASLQGTVTDPTGAVIPNASVTLVNSETSRKQTTTTSADGFYRFSGLAPGTYMVSGEAKGFKRQELANVVVAAEQTQGINLSLTPGDVAESITVTDTAAPVLETENANVGREITRREVEGLPQFGRDPYELLRLTPNVTADLARGGNGGSVGLPNTTGPGGSSASIFQTENQVPVSANGQRVSSNNYLIDGVSVNSLSFGGTAVITPNQESVKQVLILTNAYSSEWGRNSGAQISVISKNGTDQLHGSGFFKYDSPSLNAYNRYHGVGGAPTRVGNLYRQFGGSLGGPIIRNKLFLFGSYEGLRQSSNDTATAWIETPQYRQAVINARPNSVSARVFQSPGIEPRVINVLNVPCPSAFAATACQVVNGGVDLGSITGAPGAYTTTTGAGFDNIPDMEFAQIALPSRTNGDQYNGRVDFNATSFDTFAFSSYFTHLDTLGSDAAGGSRPMGDLYKKPLTSALTATYSRVLSPTTLNEARANFTRFSFNQVQASSSTNFGIPRIEVEGLPIDRIRFGAPRDETTPGIFAQNTYEFRDTLNKVLGNHGWKFGAEIRREQDNNNLVGGARPLYSFVGLFNLANDTPVFESINADPNTGLPADAQRYFRTGTYALFAQDDWKVRPNLTLNVGLRWEYFTPLREKRGRISNIAFGSQGLQNSKIVTSDQLTEPDRNNFGPRLGFAWSPGSTSSPMVVRGGFGVFYDRIPNVLYSNTRGNPPFFARYNICCGVPDNPFAGGQILYTLGANNSPFSYPVNPKLATGINPATGAPNGGTVEIYGAQRNMPNPYVYVYSLDTEYSLPGKYVASLGYSGSTGHKQIRLVNQNYLYTNNPAFFAVYIPQPDINSNYNAMLLGFRRQYAQGFLFAVNYRWAKSIDELSYGGPGFTTNQTYPQDLRSERGPSDFDVRHMLTASAVWDLPYFQKRPGFWGSVLGGWELNPIITWHTGYPWTPVIGRSVSTPGGATLSPTRPTVYFGGAGNDQSTDAFLTGSNFPGGPAKYFDITHSGPPGIGRNSFRGPRFFQTDLSFMKNTRLGFINEVAALELRANFFNLFNQLNLTPIAFGSDSAHADNATFFGRAGSGLAGRVVELQARFSF